MEKFQKLFSGENQNLFRELIRKLEKVPEANLDIYLKAKEIIRVTEIFINNAQQVDQYCQINIKWIGNTLFSDIANLSDPLREIDRLDRIFSIFYRIVVEFDLSIKNDLSRDLRSFQNFVKNNLDRFTDDAKEQIVYARQEMPIAVLKQILNQDEIENLKNISTVHGQIEKRFQDWETTLDAREARAKSLQDSLKSYETAFNFVGLYDGFKDLANDKKGELARLRLGMSVFGLLLLLPLLAEFCYIYINRDLLSNLAPYFLFATAMISLSLTAILIYFFRIFLRDTDSCKAQLLQIELRKTLCRFIQSYASYSKDIKENNSESLSKFENIIFSRIISSSEKLPSTFDGIDQIANLITTIKNKPLTNN
jgi:hypothetical protein